LGLYALKLGFLFRGINIFSPYPILNVDFVQYYARALRAQEFFNLTGHIWGYDPFEMGGYISGIFLAVGTYFISIPAVILSGIFPIHKTVLWIEILGISLAPFTILSVVRNFGGNWDKSWMAFGFTNIFLYFIDGYTVPAVRGGAFGFILASFIGLWQVSFLWKWLRGGNWKHWLFYTFLSVIVFQIHAAIIVVISIPTLVLVLMFSLRGPRFRIPLMLITLGLVAWSNWFWIKPFLLFSNWLDYAPYSVTRGWQQLAYLLFPIQENIILSLRNLIRAGLVVMTVRGAWRILSIGNRRMGIFISISILWLFFVSTFGSQMWWIQNLQPLRYILPLWLFMICVSVFGFDVKFSWKNPILGILLLCVLVSSARLISVAAPKWSTQFPEYQQKLIEYIQGEGPFSGRFLIECDEDEQPHFEDLIPFLTNQILLGGPHPGNFMKPRFSNFTVINIIRRDGILRNDPTLFSQRMANIQEKEFSEYMDLYNVRQIAVRSNTSKEKLRTFVKTLKRLGEVGIYEIFGVNKPSGWIVDGEGEVKVNYNEINIMNPPKGRFVLKFHWLSTLRAEKNIPLYPVYIGKDPIPFIGVNNQNNAGEIRIDNETF